MCNGRTFPRWQADAIRSLLELPGVEVSVLIVRAPKSRFRVIDVLRDWRHLLWTLYEKVYVHRRSRASAPVSLASELGEVPEITCQTEKAGRYGEAFVLPDLEKIQRYDLDLLVRFAFGILKGEILKAARFGIWSFHHGDEREYRGQPPAFWEMFDGRPTVGAILQVLSERLDAGTILHRGVFRISPQSYRRSRDEVLLGSSDFLSIAIRQLQQREGVVPALSTTTATVRRSPRNGQVIRFLIRQANAFVSGQWNGLTQAAKWSVGVADGSVGDILCGRPGEIDWTSEQGYDRYLADPFLDPTGRTNVALVEDYNYASHRGVISAIDLQGDRTARQVLDTGVHASYPFLFEFQGEIYCTPETYQAREVRLYKAVRWPDQWVLVGTVLQDVPALDPTLFEYENRWWLFCSIEGPHSNTKLYAYHGESPFGPFVQHSLNPIKTSVTSGRPAGRPFKYEGRFFRPAQNSSTSYGGSLTLNRIDELTPSSFAESEVVSIFPSDQRYSAGIHTLGIVGTRIVIDGRRDKFIASAFRRELGGRLKRLRGPIS